MTLHQLMKLIAFQRRQYWKEERGTNEWVGGGGGGDKPWEPSIDAVDYQTFNLNWQEIKLVPLHPEDGGCMDIQNFGILPQHYTESQLRRARFETWLPWKNSWKQHGLLKRWYHTTTPHGVTTQKTSTWIFTAVKVSYLARCQRIRKPDQNDIRRRMSHTLKAASFPPKSPSFSQMTLKWFTSTSIYNFVLSHEDITKYGSKALALLAEGLELGVRCGSIHLTSLTLASGKVKGLC
jgi:hypothetical protein